MKINYNCLRELLIVLEDNLHFSEDLEYPALNLNKVSSLMPDYTLEDIAYSTIMANEANLIEAHIINADNRFYNCIYSSLTYEGHQFLENVKSNTVWEKTKKITKQIGSTSIGIISSVASDVLKQLISQQFGG